jgi:RNase P subunit RPR2
VSRAQHRDLEISGHALWEARKRIGASRGLVGRMLGLHDKTVGAIERKNLPIPEPAKQNATLFIELAGNDPRGRTWEPKAREPKIRLPFARPSCPTCTLLLVVKSANHLSPQRGRYFYFRCPSCKEKFWSNDGIAHRAKIGRGNWKELPDRVSCPDCDQMCWADGRASKRHGKRVWECPRCKKHYFSVQGKPVVAVLPKRLKRIPFLNSRICPKCRGERLRLRARPPNAPHWYFNCPDCGTGYRWNKKLERLVIAKGPSKKRRVGRTRGMSKPRIADAKRLLELQAQHAQRGGSRGALKKAVAEVFPKDNPASAYVRANRILYDYRQLKRQTK